MPVWVNMLEVAEAWGVPPWVVGSAAVDADKAAWYHRQLAWSRACAKRADIEAKKRSKHG